MSDIHEKRQAEESLREKLNQHQLLAQRKENFQKQITHFTNVSTALEKLDTAKAIYEDAQTKIKRLEKAKDIDPTLMERYQTIKKHCIPPVAKLVNGQCGGCYMSLPQVTLRNLKAGVKVIECESCGRMIVQL